MNIREYTDAGLKSLFMNKETEIKMIRARQLSLQKELEELISDREEIIFLLVERGFKVKFQL
jgi:hypothetical protein